MLAIPALGEIEWGIEARKLLAAKDAARTARVLRASLLLSVAAVALFVALNWAELHTRLGF